MRHSRLIILVYLQCFSLTCLPLIFTQFLCYQPTISLDPSHDVFSGVFWRGLHAAIMGTGPAGLPSSESFVPKITTHFTEGLNRLAPYFKSFFDLVKIGIARFCSLFSRGSNGVEQNAVPGDGAIGSDTSAA